MPFNIDKNFIANPDKEKEGVVVQLGSDSWIRISRIGGSNKKFGKLFAEATSAYEQIGLGNMPEEEAVEALAKCIAEAVVLDWDGIELGGEAVPYSVENVKDVCLKAPEFAGFIMDKAKDITLFQDEAEAQEAKN